jgi:hypothetical protein
MDAVRAYARPCMVLMDGAERIARDPRLYRGIETRLNTAGAKLIAVHALAV